MRPTCHCESAPRCGGGVGQRAGSPAPIPWFPFPRLQGKGAGKARPQQCTDAGDFRQPVPWWRPQPRRQTLRGGVGNCVAFALGNDIFPLPAPGRGIEGVRSGAHAANPLRRTTTREATPTPGLGEGGVRARSPYEVADAERVCCSICLSTTAGSQGSLAHRTAGVGLDFEG